MPFFHRLQIAAYSILAQQGPAGGSGGGRTTGPAVGGTSHTPEELLSSAAFGTVSLILRIVGLAVALWIVVRYLFRHGDAHYAGIRQNAIARGVVGLIGASFVLFITWNPQEVLDLTQAIGGGIQHLFNLVGDGG